MRHFSRLCFFLFSYNLLPKSLDMFFAKFLTIKKNRNFVMRKIKRSFVKLRRKNNSSRIINWSKANYYDFIISRFQLLLFVSFIRVKCKIHYNFAQSKTGLCICSFMIESSNFSKLIFNRWCGTIWHSTLLACHLPMECQNIPRIKL